jgi:hypothetical protein
MRSKVAESYQPQPGQVVELKKGHPCGENRWEISRLGMDVKLRCLGCGHYVTLPRQHFERRLKRLVQSASTKQE